VARLGGDEFAVILEDCRLLNACAIAENIREAVQRYEYTGKHGTHRLEVSIGLVELRRRHSSPEDALHDADSACYEAKRLGRNRVCIYSETGHASDN
jgi:diguanylate cyclase (GGDEF)-like protein